MKKLVLNIPRREDRRKHFLKHNESKLSNFEWIDGVDGRQIQHSDLLAIGADTDRFWRDQFYNRKLTHGDVGCLLAHRAAWVKVSEQDEPMMIIEDDAIVLDAYDEQYYESLINDYNIVYLQRNENEPENVKSIDDMIEVPAYPYNLTAYILTPESAKILLNTNIVKNIIPDDEYVPLMLKHLKPCALKEDVFQQASRDVLGSDIEPYDEADWFIDFKVHPITIGTDRKKCSDMNTSANLKGIYPKNLGNNVEWKGTDMVGPGGGHKVNLLRDYIKDLPDYDVVLFTDAYDVLYNDDLESITRRYIGYNSKVVFAAESNCWPDPSLAEQFEDIERTGDEDTKYKYLNSGLFIAQVGELKKMLDDDDVEDDGDDQLYYQKIFLSGKYDIRLDYESYILQCHEPEMRFSENGQFYNPITNCCACIYHGNGDDIAKKKYDSMATTIKQSSPMIYIPNYDKVERIGDDMFVIDFMTQSQCEDMMEVADRHGGWGSLSYDKFPAQEIRLTELGYWDSMEKHWKENVNPIIEKFWYPMEMYGLRDAFVMRYSVDTQKELSLHTDASLVTGSVKLNDDYEGADLVFPRQNVSNSQIPVGKAIIFPGMVTHGHECQELMKGTKYSLTMWTSRYHGDIGGES